ncbi:unnamed protein product [Meganyctiphanes norvegica]|uniref:Helix-turn-helix domain-containing protein n=1 Tax=Meganyctiphanes norvegica TaxID=48144 RepID=A0AAV2PSB6_MEGNR
MHVQKSTRSRASATKSCLTVVPWTSLNEVVYMRSLCAWACMAPVLCNKSLLIPKWVWVKNLTSYQVAAITFLCKAGHSNREITELTGVCKPSVQRWTKKFKDDPTNIHILVHL